MKIAIVSPMHLPVSPAGGSVEQLLLNIIEKNEQEKKIDIDLYTPFFENNERQYDHTTFYKIKINSIDILSQKIHNVINKIIGKERYISIIKKTIKELKKHDYDKIIIENNMYLYKEINKTIGDNNKLYYHMHNDFNDTDKTPDNYIFIEKTAEKIFVVSDYIKDRLNSVKKSDKIKVLLNSVDVEKLNSNKKSQEQIRKLKSKLNIKDSDLTIAFIGRVSKEKGIEELIHAFKYLYQHNKNLKLLIVGSLWFGKKKSNFEKLLETEIQDIKQAVIFTGYINYKEIPQYYQISDMVVIPSICKEAMPLTAIEAMHFNLPIVSTRQGGLVGTLGDAALYVDHIDHLEEELIILLDKLISDTDARRCLQQKCKERINTGLFSSEMYFENFCKYIK